VFWAAFAAVVSAVAKAVANEAVLLVEAP